MAIPAEGDIAPDFTLPTDSGQTFQLSSQRGKLVVMFFYPEDDTEGCTIENQEYSALMPQFHALGVVVVGISPDSVEKHCAFRDKYSLGAILAADPDHIAIGAYNVWRLKKRYGREFEGIVRTTVIVDAAGRIARNRQVTRIKGHAERTLAIVTEMLAKQ